jgi:hypothetical protein
MSQYPTYYDEAIKLVNLIKLKNEVLNKILLLRTQPEHFLIV